MSNVDGLAAEWLQLKAQEKEVIAKRHAIEAQITKALDAKDEGTISHKLDQHKVTLTAFLLMLLAVVIWPKKNLCYGVKLPRHLRVNKAKLA